MPEDPNKIQVTPDDLERYLREQAARQPAGTGPDLGAPAGGIQAVTPEQLEAVMAKESVEITDVDTAEMQLKIENCYSCNGPHEGLACHGYKTGHAPFTHWYTCPTTGDPCTLTLKHRKNQNAELNRDVLGALTEAQQAGTFMVIICFVEEGVMQYRRMTFAFPHNFFHNVATDVKVDLEKEIGPPPAGDMEAGDPKPLTNLFSS